MHYTSAGALLEGVGGCEKEDSPCSRRRARANAGGSHSSSRSNTSNSSRVSLLVGVSSNSFSLKKEGALTNHHLKGGKVDRQFLIKEIQKDIAAVPLLSGVLLVVNEVL